MSDEFGLSVGIGSLKKAYYGPSVSSYVISRVESSSLWLRVVDAGQEIGFAEYGK